MQVLTPNITNKIAIIAGLAKSLTKMLSQSLVNNAQLTYFQLFLIVSFAVIGLNVKVYAVNNDSAENRQITPINSQVQKAYLAEKFYRQALYYYFQNQPELALRQLSFNQQYLTNSSSHALLFEAGLQSSQGMHQQAELILTKLINTPVELNTEHLDSRADKLKNKQLMLVVLLQLSEQQIANGQYQQAQATLAKIKEVPAEKLSQYLLQQQLIHWPDQPIIHDSVISQQITNTPKQNLSPYVLFNQAIWQSQQQDINGAIEKLTYLKNFSWPKNNTDFWQGLFSFSLPFTSENTELELTDNIPSTTVNNNQANNELLGIHHYAQLLLAQFYIQQGDFELSYQALSNFPKNSAFSEQALFLFGYSALKMKQYQQSAKVLNLLVEQYPYSTYTRQAFALLAALYVEQNQLPLALNQYLAVEQYYLNKLAELDKYATAIDQQTDLFHFYQQLVNNYKNDNGNNKAQNSNYQWLVLSKQKQNIAWAYDALAQAHNLNDSVLNGKTKSDWINNIIALNEKRKLTIAQSQQQANYSAQITALSQAKEQLTAQLLAAKATQNGDLFASPKEQKLLDRVNTSQQILTSLEGKKNTDDYQVRLKRVERVLTWQLQQTYTERYWQHQGMLTELENLLTNTQKQYQSVTKLLAGKSKLGALKQKSSDISQHIELLSTDSEKLKSKLNQQILLLSKAFIKQQQEDIKQHLLHSQNAMVQVIEQLNQQDAL